MRATLIDNTLNKIHHLAVDGVKDAVNQMLHLCCLSWTAHEEEQPAALLTKLNICRMDGPEISIWAVAYYEGNEQTYLMIVRP